MLALDQLQSETRRVLGDAIIASTTTLGELTVVVEASGIAAALRALRDDSVLALNQLIDICGVDFPDRPVRFDVVYHLLGMRSNARLRVKVAVTSEAPVPTVTQVFSTAGWFEREVWDMFGIAFAGNPDMRRILTDYGFEGHPLRKDFPLTGYTEVRYDETQKRVIYEPVSLPQDFRSFDFLSPWEGMTFERPLNALALPGDEKAEQPGPKV